MRVTYIGHSGFSVELESHILLFDYYEGTMPEFDPAKKLLVFASHSHPDHFNREILKLADVYPDVEYIFPKDIRIAKKEQRASEHFMRKRDEITVGDTKVKSLRSTDEGVAFLVRCEDRIIYHAGDLNWWHWEEEDDAYNRMMRGDYQKEIETLAGEKIDLAFVVLDPRQEEQFYWGFDWYMRHTDTKIVFPMHMWKQYEVQDRLIGMEVSEPYREKIMRVREKGQVFIQMERQEVIRTDRAVMELFWNM